MTTQEEVRTLGLHLGCDPYDIEYRLKKHQDVRETTYEIFLWFEENYADEVEKWSVLIKALREMDKNKTVTNLGLEDLLENVKMKQGLL